MSKSPFLKESKRSYILKQNPKVWFACSLETLYLLTPSLILPTSQILLLLDPTQVRSISSCRVWEQSSWLVQVLHLNRKTTQPRAHFSSLHLLQLLSALGRMPSWSWSVSVIQTPLLMGKVQESILSCSSLGKPHWKNAPAFRKVLCIPANGLQIHSRLSETVNHCCNLIIKCTPPHTHTLILEGMAPADDILSVGSGRFKMWG